MAKLDQGYRKARAASSSSTGSRSRRVSMSTFLRENPKDRIADLYIRSAKKGILDVLGLHENSDMAMSIEKQLREDLKGDKKAELASGYATAVNENNRDAVGRMNQIEENKRTVEAQALLDALYSATSMRERTDLDDGDLLDDAVNLMVDGEGWGEESKGRLEVRKHVNIAIDNSGSTHVDETGYCNRSLVSVASDLMGVLQSAGRDHEMVTYDTFTFNRVTEQHTGERGEENRAELAFQQLQNIYVDDPLEADATETNLAPLLENFHINEVRRSKIGEPRIEIILTDGEFESPEDMAEAIEWQRKRGPGVNTYVLNVCPDDMDNNIPLPHQFKVIPVNCIKDEFGIKEVDRDVLRQVLNRIVISEVSNMQDQA